MTHELKHIIQKAFYYHQKGEQCVLASVVALDGTSYRKPGVRMLISQNGEMVGAVSGGCVEKDIQQRAQAVFENKEPLIMAYDGRYRLGCQGTLYILIEPFYVDNNTNQQFNKHLEKRTPIKLFSSYKKEDNAKGNFGTIMQLDNKEILFSKSQAPNMAYQVFEQALAPAFKLLIIGAEHDALKLCTLAANMGWEVDVVSGWKDPKTKDDFPLAKHVLSISPEMLETENIDGETAVVLMTHNYALDLKYLLRLKELQMAYLGVLGSRSRNEQLRAEMFEYTQSLEELAFYGPIGLDIGSETPEEIAVAIIAEILAVRRNRDLPHLSGHK